MALRVLNFFCLGPESQRILLSRSVSSRRTVCGYESNPLLWRVSFLFLHMSSPFKPPHLWLFGGGLNSSLKHYVIINKQSHVAWLCGKYSISLLWCWFHCKNREPKWWGQWASCHTKENAKSMHTEQAELPWLTTEKWSSLLFYQPDKSDCFPKLNGNKASGTPSPWHSPFMLGGQEAPYPGSWWAWPHSGLFHLDEI